MAFLLWTLIIFFSVTSLTEVTLAKPAQGRGRCYTTALPPKASDPVHYGRRADIGRFHGDETLLFKEVHDIGIQFRPLPKPLVTGHGIIKLAIRTIFPLFTKADLTLPHFPSIMELPTSLQRQYVPPGFQAPTNSSGHDQLEDYRFFTWFQDGYVIIQELRDLLSTLHQQCLTMNSSVGVFIDEYPDQSAQFARRRVPRNFLGDAISWLTGEY